jgi:hypothetical protein
MKVDDLFVGKIVVCHGHLVVVSGLDDVSSGKFTIKNGVKILIKYPDGSKGSVHPSELERSEE